MFVKYAVPEHLRIFYCGMLQAVLFLFFLNLPAVLAHSLEIEYMVGYCIMILFLKCILYLPGGAHVKFNNLPALLADNEMYVPFSRIVERVFRQTG